MADSPARPAGTPGSLVVIFTGETLLSSVTVAAGYGWSLPAMTDHHLGSVMRAGHRHWSYFQSTSHTAKHNFAFRHCVDGKLRVLTATPEADNHTPPAVALLPGRAKLAWVWNHSAAWCLQVNVACLASRVTDPKIGRFSGILVIITKMAQNASRSRPLPLAMLNPPMQEIIIGLVVSKCGFCIRTTRLLCACSLQWA